MRRFSHRGLLRSFFHSPTVANWVHLQQYRLSHTSTKGSLLKQWTSCPEVFQNYLGYSAASEQLKDKFGAKEFPLAEATNLTLMMSQSNTIQTIARFLRNTEKNRNVEFEECDSNFMLIQKDPNVPKAPDHTSPPSTPTTSAPVTEPPCVGWIGCINKQDVVLVLHCRSERFIPTEDLLEALSKENIVVSRVGKLFQFLVPSVKITKDAQNALDTVCDAIVECGPNHMWEKLRSSSFQKGQIYHDMSFRIGKGNINVRPEPEAVVDFNYSFQTQRSEPYPSLLALREDLKTVRRGFVFPGPSGSGKTLAALALLKHLADNLLPVLIDPANCFGFCLVDKHIKRNGNELTDDDVVAACAEELWKVLEPVLQHFPNHLSDEELSEQWKKHMALFYFVIDEMGAQREIVRMLVENEDSFRTEMLKQLKAKLTDDQYNFLTRKVRVGTDNIQLDLVQFAFAVVGTGVGASNSDGTNSLNDTYVIVRTEKRLPMAVFLQHVFTAKKLGDLITPATINEMIEHGIRVKYITPRDSEPYCARNPPDVFRYIVELGSEGHEHPVTNKDVVNAMLYCAAVAKDEVCAELLTNARCATLLAKEVAQVTVSYAHFSEKSLQQLVLQMALRVAYQYEQQNGWSEYKTKPAERTKLWCYLVSLAHTQPLGFHLLSATVQKKLREYVGAVEDMLTFQKLTEDQIRLLNIESAKMDLRKIELGQVEDAEQFEQLTDLKKASPFPIGFVCEEIQNIKEAPSNRKHLGEEHLVTFESPHLRELRKVHAEIYKKLGLPDDAAVVIPKLDQLDCSLFPKHTVSNQFPHLKRRGNVNVRWELNPGVLMVALLRNCGVAPADIFSMDADDFYERLYATKTLMVLNAFHYALEEVPASYMDDLSANAKVVEANTKLLAKIEQEAAAGLSSKVSSKGTKKQQTRNVLSTANKKLADNQTKIKKIEQILTEATARQSSAANEFQLPLELVDPSVPLAASPRLTLRGDPYDRRLLKPEFEGHYETNSTLEQMADRIDLIVTDVARLGTVLELAGAGTPRSDTMLFSTGVIHQFESKNYFQESQLHLDKLLKRCGQCGFDELWIQRQSSPVLIWNAQTRSYRVAEDLGKMFPFALREKFQASLVFPDTSELSKRKEEECKQNNELLPSVTPTKNKKVGQENKSVLELKFAKFRVSWWNNNAMDKGFRASVSNAGWIRHSILEQKLRRSKQQPCHQSVTVVSPHRVLPNDTDICFRKYRNVREKPKPSPGRPRHTTVRTPNYPDGQVTHPSSGTQSDEKDPVKLLRAIYSNQKKEKNWSWQKVYLNLECTEPSPGQAVDYKACVYNATWSLSSFLTITCKEAVQLKVSFLPDRPTTQPSEHCLQHVDFRLTSQSDMTIKEKPKWIGLLLHAQSKP